ncbi:MAG: hypothetical protein A3F67_01385 [Verrucomicrobia bacterium RIFCSPHIGHO2_12_FULL_41_10]|nr:MAG: hypothetical protein A3F67_01385 [Verrucomicrobia bacterium RIFCSPHIGHO2_12_FULL_41_10]
MSDEDFLGRVTQEIYDARMIEDAGFAERIYGDDDYEFRVACAISANATQILNPPSEEPKNGRDIELGIQALEETAAEAGDEREPLLERAVEPEDVRSPFPRNLRERHVHVDPLEGRSLLLTTDLMQRLIRDFFPTAEPIQHCEERSRSNEDRPPRFILLPSPSSHEELERRCF